MGKKKAPAFSKMVCEALTTADDEKGMNSKMILDFIKKKYSITGDDKSNLNLIHKELERGKGLNEYLQVKGDSVHGFFTFNIFYQPPSEIKSKELPDYMNPPEATGLPVQAPQEPKKRNRRQKKADEDREVSKPDKGDSKYALIRILPSGRVEEGKLDEHGNMKFSLCKSMPYMSRAQVLQMQQAGKYKRDSMEEENAKELANDPLFRRVFAQTETKFTDPELQKQLDKDSFGKSKRFLRGDKTDALRLGNKSCISAKSEDTRKDEEHEQVPIKDDNATGTSIEQKMSQLKVEKKKKKLHPQVEEILKLGVVTGFVDMLKSSDDEMRAKALTDLNKMIHGTIYEKLAVVEAGAIPHFVNCICLDDFGITNLAVSNLLLLCGKLSSENKTSDVCKDMIEAGVLEKLMELMKGEEFQSEESLMSVLEIPLTLLVCTFARYLRETRMIMAEDRFHTLLNLILEVMEFVDDDMFSPCFNEFVYALYMYFSKDRKYVWHFDFPDSKIDLIYSQFETSEILSKDAAMKFFLLLLTASNGEHHIPRLVELGFIDSLLDLLENTETVVDVLACFTHIIDQCCDGYKYILDAGVVPEISPLITSNDKEIRGSATHVFASLIDAKVDVVAPHIDGPTFMIISKNFKEFKMSNASLDTNLCKLAEHIKNRHKGDVRKIVRRVRRSKKH